MHQARSHTFQLRYLDGTHQQEKGVQSELDDRLGEDVYKFDLREAMIQAAFENLGDVADILGECGYNTE